MEGLPGALWVITTLPCPCEIALGFQVTVTVHEAAGANCAGQLLVGTKSVFAVETILAMARGACPELVTVEVCVELDPIMVLGKEI